jgi:pseudoazurin
MRVFIILLFGLFVSGSIFAEDTTIEMLNKLEKENMVFSKKIVKVNVGDTVFWKAVNKGHNVEFIMKGGVPAGVEKFKSKVGQDTEYTFLIPGIYAYWCTPHKTMGMIGFIIVDNDLSNLDSIKNIKYLGKSKKIAATIISTIEK